MWFVADELLRGEFTANQLEIFMKLEFIVGRSEVSRGLLERMTMSRIGVISWIQRASTQSLRRRFPIGAVDQANDAEESGWVALGVSACGQHPRFQG
jgi:hypothetical protein